MNDNENTSSASSADKLAELIRQIDGNHTMGAAALAEALLPHLAAIVPQVVQAPKQYGMREKSWKYGLTQGPVMVLYVDSINDEQVCRDDLWLATTSQLAAPIVATVPSDSIIVRRDKLSSLLSWVSCPPNIYKDLCKPFEDLLAAPSPTEQASDVRNAVLIKALQSIAEESEDEMTRDCAIRALKSAPAAKGNAPAEVKS